VGVDAVTTQHLAERDRNEIDHSALEAAKTNLTPVEIERYLPPPPDTPYELEYAYCLLGDVQGKTVLDLECGSGENLIPLLKRGANVIGLDISPELIELAPPAPERLWVGYYAAGAVCVRNCVAR